MRRAARVIRSSQGSDDKIGLDVQRQATEDLANKLDVDELVDVDLGINTGFSLFTRGVDVEDSKRIDQHPNIQDLLRDLRAGDYDYLIAYDDTRVARDRFFSTVEHACIEGDCEMEFVADSIDLDDMSFWINRIVETQVKIREMEKAQEVLEHRREQGYWKGRPRWGTQYDDDSQYLEPAENFREALRAIELREEGNSYREILDRVDPLTSTSTLRTILDNTDWYRDLAAEHEIEPPEPAVATDGGDSGDDA